MIEYAVIYEQTSKGWSAYAPTCRVWVSPASRLRRPRF